MFPRIFAAACLVALVPVLSVDGQGCYHNGRYQGSYYRPAPYGVPNPGANYYHAPQPYLAQKVVTQEIAVAPLVVTVPIHSQAVPIHAYGASHYYSVQEAYQQRAMIRDVIREELRSYLQTQGGTPAASPQNSPALPRSKGPAELLPGPKGGPTGPAGKKVPDLGPDTATDQKIAQAVVGAWARAKCLTCHTGETVDLSGGLRLAYVDGTNYRLARQSKERAWMIYGQMSTGWMPPAARTDGSKAAPQDTLPPVLQWVVQGIH